MDTPGGYAVRAAIIAIFVAVASPVRAQPDAAPAPPPDAAPAVDLTPDAAPPDAAPAPDAPAVETPAIVEEPAVDESDPGPGIGLGAIQIHGFVSEGGFVSTSNDYIGKSSRGSLELFEAGINFSTEVANRLRAGIQLFARDVGAFEDEAPHLDWAFLDYQWRPWLGLRAGIIKMPFGLYNEYSDIDAARVPILMPQGIYPLATRDVLLSHRGFGLYGNYPLGSSGGELEYQAWLGTLAIPENALTLSGATLDRKDAKYVTGAQLFWQTPLEGLRVGGTFLRASLEFELTLSDATIQFLMSMGLVPADYDGKLILYQRPIHLVIGSAEYVHDDWLFAAEYTRQLSHQRSSLPMVFPERDGDTERFYGMVNRRFTPWLELGAYYSVTHLVTDDRRGRDPQYMWPERWWAFQRDAAVTARFDINDHWLWKVEAHFIDGVADVPKTSSTMDLERYWGLFLFKTTVTY